ncbi:MAG: AraC family transcriptional regulator [Porticoccaceae bacterium]|nr:AraC family transcriptional regulator [Porticoccaceae bacterium]
MAANTPPENKLASSVSAPGGGHWVSSAYANLVFNTMGQSDEVEACFARHGISKEQLADSSAKVAFDPLSDAIFELMESQNMPDAGLSIGRQIHISSHGAMGVAVISSETVGQAIHDAAKYYHTSITFCDLEVYYDKDSVIVEIVETHGNPDFQTVVVEAMMLTMQNALEFVSGQSLDCSQVVFAFPPPEYASEYGNFFSGEINFNGDKHMMILPKAILDKRCITADEHIHRLAEDQLQQKMQELRSNNLTMGHVLELMRRQPNNMPSLEDLAKVFNVSSRTIIRYLQAENTTYRKLRDSVHKQLATDALRNTDHSIDAIALGLGYQDTTSFRRAFKRWCGCSPSEYRNKAPQ